MKQNSQVGNTTENEREYSQGKQESIYNVKKNLEIHKNVQVDFKSFAKAFPFFSAYSVPIENKKSPSHSSPHPSELARTPSSVNVPGIQAVLVFVIPIPCHKCLPNIDPKPGFPKVNPYSGKQHKHILKG